MKKVITPSEKEKVLKSYPDRIICLVRPKSEKDPCIDKHKYIVPKDITFSNFVSIIRKRINLSAAESIFFFAQNRMIPMNMCMNEVKQNYSEDDVLYISYTKENTFGGH